MTDTPLTGSEIAVVGMAGRFPGAPDLDAFWRNLREGVESIRRFTPDELVRAGESPELLADPSYVNARPYLDGIDLFDADFFGLSPQDAAITDPQHRVFLEVGWEALEHAGYDAARISGQVGVFATCGMNSYMMYHLVTNPRIMRTVGEWLVRHTGNDMSFLATSLSYHLNLKGPSLNVQCACSSALVAIHLASQSLLSGECDMALAGGSVIVLPQDRGYLYQDGEILAQDGHCRPFDAHASGTLFGSGAGVVVLRRLSDALADGDAVRAVIKGSATNNDGSMKVGFLAPSVEGQSRVVTEALAISGVDPESISYIEAHGTGTIVGDPIEVTALTEAFRRHTQKRGFCRIGSLKSNIGHLGEAAGVAAFIKTVLSLQHRELPPSLNFSEPNPRVDFAASPFVVNDARTEWASDEPRRAGVTALGAGGTNCHVIVEEAPSVATPAASRPEQLLILSAKTPAALQQMRDRLADALERPDAPNLADAAYTLHVGRAQFAYRWSGVCASREQAVQILRRGGVAEQIPASTTRPSAVFLFPGGGAQYPNMGRGLYEREPVFRDAVDRSLSILRTKHGIDLRDLLFPAPAAIGEAAQALSRSTNSILSIFVVEYALSQLWMSWGIAPVAMSGHSLGEYVAACLSGVFSLEDALSIVKARGDIFERLPVGGMLSVLLSEADVLPRLSGRLALAAINAPESCVVSGPADEIRALDERLKADGIETQPLHIAVAAHSPMLEPFLDEFRRAVSAATLSAPTIPFVSNLTGQWATAADVTDPSYWVRHLRHTVRFADGLATVLAKPDQILIEVGPGRTLASLAKQQPVKPLGIVTSLRHPNEDFTDHTTMLAALGRVWAAGLSPDWAAVHADGPRRRALLPAYPFQRQRHWIDAGVPAVSSAVAETSAGAATKQQDIADWFFVPGWVPAPLPDSAPPAAVNDIIVFADAAGLAREAAERARPTGSGRTYLVERGDRFARASDDRFVVNPIDVADYVALFDAIGESITSVSHIVDGWTLPPAESETVDQGLDRSFFAPLALGQALGRAEIDHAAAITFLTADAIRIAGEPTTSAVAATLFGPSRVLPRELPSISTRVVDVRVPTSAWQREQLVDAIAAEMRHAGDEAVAAYRGTTRWTESIGRRRLSAGDRSPLREHGVYVITGGTGGIGLEIAVHLARTARAKLVLIGRTPLLPRQEWDRWIGEHGADDATSRRLSRLLECESLGSELLIAAADVTDEAALHTLRSQILSRFGAVHGIFHAAGTLDDGPMQVKTRDSALAVLRPKVHGTIALQTAFNRDALDFLVLFSSISSVLGLQGQVDYTAANAFLDQFASIASDGPSRVIAVDWGPWRDVGLAVTASQQRQTAKAKAAAHPWLDDVRADGERRVLTTRLTRARQWMIGEHVVKGGEAVLPGTGYLELARAALAEIGGGPTIDIADVLFQSPIIVPPNDAVAVEMTLVPSGAGYECTWRTNDEVRATATLSSSSDGPRATLDVASIRTRCRARIDEPHGFLDQPFMAFGPRWANIQRASYGTGEALIELALPPELAGDTREIRLHPALLDMATGGAQALIPGFDQTHHFYVPFSYGRVRIFAALPPKIVSHVRLAEGTARDIAVFDVTIADESGRVLVEITAFCMTRVASGIDATAGSSAAAASRARLAPQAGSPAAALADELLKQGLTTQEGLEALTRVLQSPAGPRVVVSTIDLAPVLAQMAAWRRTPTSSANEGHEREATGDALLAFDDDIERQIGRMWVDLLGVSVVGPDDNFFEAGGHSLLAVRLLARIERTFKCTIPLHALFSAGTVRDLAGRIRAATSRDVAGQQAEPDDDLPLIAVPREQLRLSKDTLDKPHGR